MQDSIWFPIRLKLEEAQFFLNQIDESYQDPRLVLFYLSAYVSSARSLSFHIEKQISSLSAEHLSIYKAATSEFFSDELSCYFVNLRNETLHRMYIPLAFNYIESKSENGKEYAVLHAFSGATRPNDEHLDWLQSMLKPHKGFPSQKEAQWVLADFPGKKYHLYYACRLYFERLTSFVGALQTRISSLPGPEASSSEA